MHSLLGGAAMLFFPIVFLIAKSRFLLLEIAKKFIYIMLTKRENIGIIFVCIASSLGGAAMLFCP